jgi:FkbH-like protein
MESIKEIKCIVWDLDNTIWDGVLLESDEVQLKPGIRNVLEALDGRGILHSIASKNNHEDAFLKLKEFGIDHYFLYPKINWNAKSASIAEIQANLNFGMDAIAFIDDQEFEREEVKSQHPDVLFFDAMEYERLLIHQRCNPRFITEDSRNRRLMYHSDIVRNSAEQEYRGPKEEFLASLKMEFIISEAKEEDLKRAEELTVRTNQLNATGRTYDYDELNAFRLSEDHRLLVCELTDKYGSYGKIGLALVQIREDAWHVRLLLMSCRVMARGVGTILLTHIMNEAKASGKRLLADFRQTTRNRMMWVAYKFANFVEVEKDGDCLLLGNDLSQIQQFPGYITITINR